ncbi:unnamed protein product [Prunus brigantina]
MRAMATPVDKQYTTTIFAQSKFLAAAAVVVADGCGWAAGAGASGSSRSSRRHTMSETEDDDLDRASLRAQWKRSEQIKGIDIEFPQGEGSETARLNLASLRAQWKR